MKKYIFILILIMPMFSLANTICTGKVQFVSINPDSDTLQFNYGYGTQYHCKLNQEHNGVSPESCQTLFSMLLAAQISGKSVEARYNGDFTCSADNLGNYTTTQHLMYWIQIKD